MAVRQIISPVVCVALLSNVAARANHMMVTDPIQPSESDTTYLDAALAAARWIKSHEIESAYGRIFSPLTKTVVERPNRKTWPVAPLESEDASFALYDGSPGVVLFFTELARYSGDESWLKDAGLGAMHVMEEDVDFSNPSAMYGLYTGPAGRGMACLTYGERANDPLAIEYAWHFSRFHYLNHVRRSGLIPNDVISGVAGWGLWVLHFRGAYENHPIVQDPQHERMMDRIIMECADLLIETAVKHDAGLSWRIEQPIERVTYPPRDDAQPIESPIKNTYPNFSHGAAGVAYFLATVHEHNRAGRYLDAAIEGAEYLLSIADTTETTCRVPRFPPDEYAAGEPQLFYWSWCHGPPGTARLFHKLHEITGDAKWKTERDKLGEAVLAAHLVDEGARERLAGWWNNVGPCCGNAGVAQFALDMYEETQDERYLTLARTLTDDLLRRATRIESDGEPDQLYWIHAEHRVRPEFLQAQTGYMQGAAGVGLWLLRMHAFENGLEWDFRLPDDPF